MPMLIRGGLFIVAGWPTWIDELRSEDKLACVERLGEPTRCTTFHPAYAHQCQKVVGNEPILAALGREMALKMGDFATRKRSRNRYISVRLPQIALVLGNLVFEHELITPCVPRKLGGQAMVLVPILQPVRKNDIRIDIALQLLEKRLHIGILRRQESVAKVRNEDLVRGSAPQQSASTVP